MTRQVSRKILVFGLPLLLVAFLVFLSKSLAFQNAPKDLSFGILMDLILTLPVLYYCLIRKTSIPKYTVVSVFIVGVIVASFIIPVEHQGLLTQIKTFAIPIAELGILGVLIYQARSVIKEMKKNDRKGVDFFDALSIACSNTLPGRVGKLLATEVGVVYYSFFANKKAVLGENDFTYFKKNGIKTTLSVFLGLIIVETGIVHILVEKWNVTVAWVLTFLGLYTCLQVFALIRSMNKRLISIDYENQLLKLRYGFFSQTAIPFQQIKSIEKSKKTLPDDKNFIALSAVDLLDPHNVVLHLNEKQTLHKIYGIEKEFSSIAIYVDDKERFVDAILTLKAF